MTALLESAGANAHKIGGTLNVDNVPEVWSRIEALESGADGVMVDLTDLTTIDSAGLAMLVQWWRRSGGHLQLTNCPGTLLALARLTDLDQVLKLPAK